MSEKITLIEENIHRLMSKQNFDSIAVSLIDFKDKSFRPISFSKGSFLDHNDCQLQEQIFDLASLTKPLTMGTAYLSQPDLFNKEMLLLLEHRAGLPDWGRLSMSSWRQIVREFEIKESEVLYSDLSFLRLMDMLESKAGKCFTELIMHLYKSDRDREEDNKDQLKYWFDLSNEEKSRCAVTGWRNGFPIQGAVHDDNAFVLKRACSHAGLFGTISGLSSALLTLDQELRLLEAMELELAKPHHRFVKGFDTPSGDNSLAGVGYSDKTFGHLGFTGTSFWIDCKKAQGIAILTNATQNYWYERKELNELRRSLASIAWK